MHLDKYARSVRWYCLSLVISCSIPITYRSLILNLILINTVPVSKQQEAVSLLNSGVSPYRPSLRYNTFLKACVRDFVDYQNIKRSSSTIIPSSINTTITSGQIHLMITTTMISSRPDSSLLPVPRQPSRDPMPRLVHQITLIAACEPAMYLALSRKPRKHMALSLNLLFQ